MYFLVQEHQFQSNDFVKSVTKLVSKYHGLTFFDFQEVVDFLDIFIQKIEGIKELHRECLENPVQAIRYVPNMISEHQWVDVTVIFGEEFSICRIIKAKKTPKS